jgi:hypothetical protein
MVTQASSWSSFYTELNNNLEVNLKMQTIIDSNLPTVSEDAWISNVSKNPGLALLVVDGFGNLVLLHNANFLQENIFCSESKVLGLCGDGRQAEVYRIDPVSASKSIEFPVPTWRDIKSSQSNKDVDALIVPEQSPTIARFNQSLWIPPLVLTTFLEAKSLVPAEVIPLLSSKFQEFDRSSPNVKACTILRPVLEFLWGVHKKLVPSTTIAVDTSNEAVDWATRQHFAYICQAQSPVLPPPFPVPPPPGGLSQTSSFEVMTDELRKIREANEKHLLHESQAADAKKEAHGWEKMPDMVQNMILKLSALQDDALPLEPCESYQKILKQAKVLGAATVINLELALRRCQVDLPTAMANAIRTGNFRANSFMVAHPFSIFNVPFTDAANMTSCNKTELDILEDGQGIPLAIAKKLSENKFHAPSSTYLLRHQLNNWYGIIQICFGDKSLVAKEAKAWVVHVDENELAYNARFKGDAEFGAKLLGAIDLAFFNLCDVCFRAMSIHDVDFGKSCLSHLRDDILGNRFHEGLPVYLLSDQKLKRDSDELDPTDSGKHPKKLRDTKDTKEKYKDLGEMVKNIHAVQDWILPGGKYKSLFTKDVISSTPPFNDSGLITCNKWHVRGFCYEKCDRKNSHKKFESSSHRIAYDTWIKSLKAKLP